MKLRDLADLELAALFATLHELQTVAANARVLSIYQALESAIGAMTRELLARRAGGPESGAIFPLVLAPKDLTSLGEFVRHGSARLRELGFDGAAAVLQAHLDEICVDASAVESGVEVLDLRTLN